jgi:hypothetical protein
MRWSGRKLQEARDVARNLGRPNVGLQESLAGLTSFADVPSPTLAAP